MLEVLAEGVQSAAQDWKLGRISHERVDRVERFLARRLGESARPHLRDELLAEGSIREEGRWLGTRRSLNQVRQEAHRGQLLGINDPVAVGQVLSRHRAARERVELGAVECSSAEEVDLGTERGGNHWAGPQAVIGMSREDLV